MSERIPAGAAGTTGAEAPVRLSRNRNYNFLWTSLLLSELAVEVVAIGFPLLILARSGSAVQIGLVASVLAVARMAATVPAGVLADRRNRRTLMLVAQCVRALALASVAVTLYLGVCGFAQLLVVAAVEGVSGSVFAPAEQAALPLVVPDSQLAPAVARNAARAFAALLLGPSLAGLTFAVAEPLPFLAVALLLAVSCVALFLLRLPARTTTTGTTSSAALREGIRWVLRQPVIRTTVAWVVLVNLVFNALVVVMLALSGEDDVGAAQIGLMMTCFGVGGLLGAVFAARLHAALPAPVIVIGASWVFAGVVALMALVPAGIPLGLLLGVAAFFFPVANTTILTYQLRTAPDELRGRLSGIIGLCSAAAEAVGPAAGGFLVAAAAYGTTSIVACAVALACIGIGATLSPSMRRFPTSREKAER